MQSDVLRFLVVVAVVGVCGVSILHLTEAADEFIDDDGAFSASDTCSWTPIRRTSATTGNLPKAGDEVPCAKHGRIKGTVCDASGNALSGVRMTLHEPVDAKFQLPRFGDVLPADQVLEAVLGFPLSRLSDPEFAIPPSDGVAGAAIAETSTDDGGSYEFVDVDWSARDGVGPCRFEVVGRRTGYDIRSSIDYRADGDLEWAVDFVAIAEHPVGVDIVDTSGAIPSSAKIICTGFNRRIFDWSPRRSTIALADGEWDIRVVELRSSCNQHAPKAVVKIDHAIPQDLDFVLQALGDVEIHIREERARETPGMWVSVESSAASERGAIPYFSGTYRPEVSTIKAGERMALARQIPYGSAVVTVGGPGVPPTRLQVEVAAERSRVDIDVVPPTRQSHTLMRIFGPDGKPLDRVCVVGPRGARPWPGGSVGEFLWPRVESTNSDDSVLLPSPEERIGLKATTPALGTVEFAMTPALDEVVDVRFEEPAELTVVVHRGVPSSKIEIWVALRFDASADSPAGVQTIFTDESGTARTVFKGLQPGRIFVGADAIDWSTPNVLHACDEVILRSGRNEFVSRLE